MGDKPGRAGELEDSPTRTLARNESIPPLLRELAHTPEVFAGSLAAGSLIGKRYRIERLVGKGGMGAVYLAIDEVLGKEVALKLVGEGIADNVDRLRDEVRLAHEVTHRNVCRTYDLEEVDVHWLVKMEYIDGETLAARVAAAAPCPSRKPAPSPARSRMAWPPPTSVAWSIATSSRRTS